jgi:thioredoxin reductase
MKRSESLEALRREAPHLVTHAEDHARLDGFAGKAVALVGGGQSALENAVLLHEHGARVHVLARRSSLRWGGPPVDDVSRFRRLLKPSAALGPGWSLFVVSRMPGLLRHLPAAARLRVLSAVLGPSGAWWLHPRFSSDITVHTGTVVRSAEVDEARVRLHLGPSQAGEPSEAPPTLDVDHVIACTGYRPSTEALTFLDPDLARQVRTYDGWPVLDAGFASSVPNLHFAGLAAAGTFGPVMRFVHGSDFAARRITRALTTKR